MGSDLQVAHTLHNSTRNPLGYIYQAWYNPRADCYTRAHPRRGVRGGQSAAQGNPAAMRAEFPGWTRGEHEHAAQYHNAQVQSLAVAWTAVADCAARITFGRGYLATDYKISGIACDDFPNALKDILRKIATDQTAHLDAMHAHRLPRISTSKGRD